MTIIDCCISLKMIKKFLVVLGVVDMRQLLLSMYLDTIHILLHLCYHNTFLELSQHHRAVGASENLGMPTT